MFKTVLFPVDQSRDSREAAETVAELVKLCGAKLIILSVEDDSEVQGSSGGSPVSRLSPEVIDQLLESAKTTFLDWGITAETLHRSGKIAFTICDVADELNVDIIIMGCRGIGLTEDGANDSVSNRVINLSPCPVLVVPQPYGQQACATFSSQWVLFANATLRPGVFVETSREKEAPVSLGTLSDRLQHQQPYILGKSFTVADVALGSMLAYIPLMLKLDLSPYPGWPTQRT